MERRYRRRRGLRDFFDYEAEEEGLHLIRMNREDLQNKNIVANNFGTHMTHRLRQFLTKVLNGDPGHVPFNTASLMS